MTVIVTDVVHGSEAAPPRNFGTTAIGELTIFTDVDGPGGTDKLVADLAKAPDCASRLPLIGGLGDPAVLPRRAGGDGRARAARASAWSRR